MPHIGRRSRNPPALGFAQSFYSRISQIYQSRFNGFIQQFSRKPLKRLLGKKWSGDHRAEAAV
jgi:hypothetical protein